MREDKELLREYACGRSETAFAELVRRHVDLVFSAALRETQGDAMAAEDITQAVFTELARKAARLDRHPAIAGWLYTCVRRMSANVRRSNERRQRREREAVAITAVNRPESGNADWREIEPWLDEAMHELSETDRAAVVLRYFENRNHRDVGMALGISETAARKRVDRALETLRGLLLKRNVTASASLSTVISSNAVQTAPLHVAHSIIAAAALAGAAAPTAILMTTFQKVLVTAAIAASIGVAFYEAHEVSKLRNQLQAQQGRSADEASVSNWLAAMDPSGGPISSSELLKLRAEATRLRKEAAPATLETADLEKFREEVLQAFSNTPPVKTLLSRTTAEVSWDQTIVTGGWKTPSGKRAVLFSTPVTVDEDGNADSGGHQVVISSKLLEYTEEAARQAGLAWFSVDGPDANDAQILNGSEFRRLIRSATYTPGVELVEPPSLQVRDRQQGEIRQVQWRQIPSGEPCSTGPVVDYLPTISADGKSVRLEINTRVNYPLLPVNGKP
jgi:RNA polymerase sigma factor (sigma-70 family)